jgi:hypothetical protein
MPGSAPRPAVIRGSRPPETFLTTDLEYLLETEQVELDISNGSPGQPAKLYQRRTSGQPE